MPILAKRFNVRSGEVGMGPLTTELLMLNFFSNTKAWTDFVTYDSDPCTKFDLRIIHSR